MLLAGSAALALVVAGVVAARHWRAPLSADAVAAFLDKAAGAGKVGFSDVRIAIKRQGDNDLRVSATATARTAAPLYSRVDSTDYLQGTLKLDPDPAMEARRLIADKDGARAPEFARFRPFPADPYQAAILTKTADAGAAYAFQATVAAHRDGDSWKLSLLSSGYIGAFPSGEPRASFGGATFLAGDAGDDARLRALAADLQAFAERVAETRRGLEAAHAAAVGARRQAFLARLAPGSVFRGVAQRAGDEEGTALYIEILGRSEGAGVSALLRNAGGWHYARPFQGSWSADDDFQAPLLTLASQAGQAIRNAGPFLEYTQAWTLALRMDARGNLSGEGGAYRYRFEYVNADQLPGVKASLMQEFEQASAAAAPHALYRGTAVSRASGASEPILLRFGERPDDGETLEAELESTTRLWKRPLRGVLIGNSRRSGGEPIRLRSGEAEAADEAPADSVLGARDAIEIRLRVENGRLTGGDERFSYGLAPVGAAELKEMAGSRAARARRVAAVLREGIAFDGTVRDDQGSVTDARLEIGGVDAQRGTIAASIHSLVQLNVYQDFRGTWDPSEGSITLVATGRGEFDYSDSLAVPFLVAPVPSTLQLALVGDSITGRIKGDAHWTIDFPVGGFLAALTEGPEPGSPAASGGVYPVFPARAGAYLLSAGSWKPLPRNNGRVVVETIHPEAPAAGSGPLGVVTEGVRRLGQKGVKLPYLEFDGKEPRPACAGDAVTVLVIGPGLAGAPLELAPVETLKDGRRGVEVAGAPPAGIEFGEQRAAAYVRPAGPGAVLLTPTSSLPAGGYALSAGAGYEFAVSR